MGVVWVVLAHLVFLVWDRLLVELVDFHRSEMFGVAFEDGIDENELPQRWERPVTCQGDRCETDLSLVPVE